MSIEDRDWYREEYFSKKGLKAPHQRNKTPRQMSSLSVNDFLSNELKEKQKLKVKKKTFFSKIKSLLRG